MDFSSIFVQTRCRELNTGSYSEINVHFEILGEQSYAFKGGNELVTWRQTWIFCMSITYGVADGRTLTQRRDDANLVLKR